MWNFRRRSNHAILSSLLHAHLNSSNFVPAQLLNPFTASELRPVSIKPVRGPCNLGFPSLFSFYFISCNSSHSVTRSLVEPEDGGDEEDDDVVGVQQNGGDNNMEVGQLGVNKDENLLRNVKAILGIIQDAGSSGPKARNKLEKCYDIIVSSELVIEVLSRVRNDWVAAFTFFLWAGKQQGYAHSVREYHLMISILGKMRKFDTAWALIDEMRGGRSRTDLSLVTPQTLMIMIRRYCAVHDVAKAINTFYALKRFKFKIGIEEFQDLLCALCRYKNVEDAEHLLFCNENVFYLDTKCFNIVLNGWCNIIVNLREAKRFWREMDRRGMARDAVSYASMITCYSKASNINDVLRLFNQMRQLGIEPDTKVYNAVIYALAKANLVKEARNIMETMENKGFGPNSVTYNSLIKPLCRSRRIDEAREVLDDMLLRGLSPSVRTFHAFFRILRNGEEVIELFEKMKKIGCPPSYDTYIMLIRKFCRWRNLEIVFKLWSELGENGMSPDKSSYMVLIHGLFLNGKLEEASKYYEAMKEKGFLPEPKIDEMLRAWVSGKEMTERQVQELKESQLDHSLLARNSRVTSSTQKRDFRKQPEIRRVTRQRGFSFWEL